MDIGTYLSRINYQKRTKADLSTLRGLQFAHMLAVPFENLDIGLNRPLRIDEDSLWEKIVVRRRGGFCYELNGLFAWLLKEIGFEVTYLNARVYNRQGQRGMDFDNLTQLVKIPGEHTCWLADVGFGDSFLEPLRIELGAEQPDGPRAYRLESVPDGIDLWQRSDEGIWERQYFFDLIPRTFPADYETACIYHQTSPQSSFTQKRIATRLTEHGRISLDHEKLIVTKNGQREVRWVVEEERDALLLQHFGISL
jgi:N-hydroxyarylamine O-acetyltransferase